MTTDLLRKEEFFGFRLFEVEGIDGENWNKIYSINLRKNYNFKHFSTSFAHLRKSPV